MNKFFEMNQDFLFENKKILIRKIKESDIETLRVWKNQNQRYFNHQKDISSEDQKKWFYSFEENKFNQLLVAELDGTLISCVGFRKKTESDMSAELFNLILGDPDFQKKGFTGVFFQNIVTQMKKQGLKSIWLEVLRTNTKAIDWYLKNGFSKISDQEMHFILEKNL